MSRSRSSSSSSRSKSKNRKKSQSNHKQRRRSKSNNSNHNNSNKYDQENTCLYIGNLDKKCTQEELKKICSEYGEYEYCYIVFEPSSHHDRNKDTKISRGYGFVKYNKNQIADKALAGLNGRQILARKVNVQVSKRTKPRQSTPGRYLGRRRSPPRRQVSSRYRRRSYSRDSSSERHRRRRHQKERKHRDRDRDREHKRRQRSRSGQKKHRRRDSTSPRK